MLILEAKERKRINKKVRTEYMPLATGETFLAFYTGGIFTITLDKANTSPMYVGRGKVITVIFVAETRSGAVVSSPGPLPGGRWFKSTLRYQKEGYELQD